MNERIAGIILAGGLSRRMGGGDKGLLALGDRPVLAHIAARLRPQVGAMALNANGDPARFRNLGLPVVPDTMHGFQGPLAGILAGLEWIAAHGGCTAALTVAGDTPFFPKDLAARLQAATAERPGAIALAASCGRQHPTFALWPLAVRAELESFLAGGNRRVLSFIEQREAVTVEFEPGGGSGLGFDPFFNINMPGDFAQAQIILQGLEP